MRPFPWNLEVGHHQLSEVNTTSQNKVTATSGVSEKQNHVQTHCETVLNILRDWVGSFLGQPPVSCLMLVWQATSVEHVMYILSSLQSAPAGFPTSCISFCSVARENVSRVIVDGSLIHIME